MKYGFIVAILALSSPALAAGEQGLQIELKYNKIPSLKKQAQCAALVQKVLGSPSSIGLPGILWPAYIERCAFNNDSSALTQ